MAARKISNQEEKRKLPRGESRKLLGDDGRRDRFKGRGKDLERGISAPSLFADQDEEGKPIPKAPMPLNEEEAITVGMGIGHDFAKKTFFQPTYCHYCSELLWGLKGQGLMCKVCNYVSHEKCISSLTTPCRHIMADLIQDPVAHTWSHPTQLKKVFCNVCRKKISSDGVICEVCKYYAHSYCKDVAFNNCKQCATYNNLPSAASSDSHHWIEGNLPSSARCQVCTKTCCSSDCLTGYRCGWCGITVHSRCFEKYSEDHSLCNFRDLWGMILVPRAISHHKIMERNPTTPMTGDSTSPNVEEEGDDEGEDDTDGGKGKPCIVVDGSCKKGFKKWRKTTIHPTYLNKKMTAQELLIISLKKCGISDDPDEYYLADVSDCDNSEERELSPDENPYNIPSPSHGVLRLYIRHTKTHKAKESEEQRGKLCVNNGHVESVTKQVVLVVTGKTTAKEIVGQAVDKFELDAQKAHDYCLVEVSSVEGVVEKVLADSDCPWKKYQDLRRSSLTLSSRQRYFLKHRKGGKTSIYLKGVDKELLKDQNKCTEFIKGLVTEESDVAAFGSVEIGPAFPSMGGIILTFPTFHLASQLTVAMEQNPATPSIIMLPSIYSTVTAVNQEPLLVFINSKSGGNQGVELLAAFCRHLNPHQVWNLAKGGPIPGLWSFRNVERFRILIGGGDGTFGWVLGALQEMKQYLKCKEPPSALLPLGTGNDLARALKWGGGYSGEKVMQVLLTLEDANAVYLDRWNVSFQEQKLPKTEKQISMGPSSVVMNNYTGIGLDAAIALDFHLAREENPEKFSSRLHNKGFYLQLGLQKMVTKTETRELRRHVALTVDGKHIDLPDIAGLIFLNIQSWGAGADPWGTTNDPAYKPASYSDGMLEVVGISGVMQMGQVQSGVRNALRIAQGKELSLDLHSPLPVQVDGEAWAQPPCTIIFKKLPDSAVLLQGPEKVAFSKAQSKKDMSLLHTVSSSGIMFSDGLSSRRSVAPPTNLTTPTEGKKDEEFVIL